MACDADGVWRPLHVFAFAAVLSAVTGTNLSPTWRRLEMVIQRHVVLFH